MWCLQNNELVIPVALKSKDLNITRDIIEADCGCIALRRMLGARTTIDGRDNIARYARCCEGPVVSVV